MKTICKSLFAAAVLLGSGSVGAFAQMTYSGNGSTGFGGPLGNSTLTVSDNATTRVVSFSLALGNQPNGTPNTGFNNIAFYLSTGSSPGISDTSSLSDYGTSTNHDSGRTSISGFGVNGQRSLAQFATGFSANFAVALDSNGNANLFQIVPGQTYLNYVTGANFTHTGNTFGFTLNESDLGLTAGASFSFVATLSNANDGGNGNFYRSNETIGASNADNNAVGNLANTGTLTYSGFDTYITSVPEPATWLGAAFCVALLGKALVSRRRAVAASV